MPVALPFIAVGIALLGTAVSTVAAVQQAKFKAQVAKFNQEINEDNAARAADRAQIAQQDQDRIAAAIRGEEAAQQAGSGLSLRSGSFDKKRQSLGVGAAQDRLRIRQAGDVEAFNFLVKAEGFKGEAAAEKRAGKFAIATGLISAAGTVAGSSLVS